MISQGWIVDPTDHKDSLVYKNTVECCLYDSLPYDFLDFSVGCHGMGNVEYLGSNSDEWVNM